MKTLIGLFLFACLSLQAQVSLTGAKLVNFSMSATPLFPGTNVTYGLTNWFTFDDGTGSTAGDSADSATGTLSGGTPPIWVTGKYGSGLSFNGINGLVQLSTNTGVGSNAFSVAVWMYSTNAHNGAFIYDSDGSDKAGFWFYRDVTNSLITLTVYATSGDMTISGPAAIPETNWFHIVAIFGGDVTHPNTCHIYTNGVEIGASYTTSASAGTHYANGSTLRYIGGGGYYFAGILDDVRVYDRVLDPTEIYYIYVRGGHP